MTDLYEEGHEYVVCPGCCSKVEIRDRPRGYDPLWEGAECGALEFSFRCSNASCFFGSESNEFSAEVHPPRKNLTKDLYEEGHEYVVCTSCGNHISLDGRSMYIDAGWEVWAWQPRYLHFECDDEQCGQRFGATVHPPRIPWGVYADAYEHAVQTERDNSECEETYRDYWDKCLALAVDDWRADQAAWDASNNGDLEYIQMHIPLLILRRHSESLKQDDGVEYSVPRGIRVDLVSEYLNGLVGMRRDLVKQPVHRFGSRLVVAFTDVEAERNADGGRDLVVSFTSRVSLDFKRRPVTVDENGRVWEAPA